MRHISTATLAAVATSITLMAVTETAALAIPVPARALPAAVVGQGCWQGSTPTVDPDGATVYCARVQYSDAFVWSRVPDTVPVRATPTGLEDRYAICARQTGWSVQRCTTDIANAEGWAGSAFEGEPTCGS